MARGIRLEHVVRLATGAKLHIVVEPDSGCIRLEDRVIPASDVDELVRALRAAQRLIRNEQSRRFKEDS